MLLFFRTCVYQGTFPTLYLKQEKSPLVATLLLPCSLLLWEDIGRLSNELGSVACENRNYERNYSYDDEREGNDIMLFQFQSHVQGFIMRR